MGDTVPNKPPEEPSEGGVGKWVRARLKRGGAWLGSLGDPCFLMRHYFWAHLSLVAALAAVGAFLLWALESSLAAGDALLMAVSAVCAVGLTSVGMPALGMPAKGVLLLLAQLASAPLLGLLPSVLRILARRRGRPPVAGERPRGVRVLALLVGVVCCYVALVQLCGFLALGFYLSSGASAFSSLSSSASLLPSPPSSSAFPNPAPSLAPASSSPPSLSSSIDKTNPWWWALFHTVSAFQNVGFALFSDGLTSFAAEPFVPLLLALLQAAGGFLLPVFLRTLLELADALLPQGPLKEDVRDLLEDPRAYTLLLFPERDTLLLLALSAALVAFNWLSFLLELGRPAVFGAAPLPFPLPIIAAFCQSVSLRAAGFENVLLSECASLHLALMALSMYLSTLPMAAAQRRASHEPQSDRFLSAQMRRFILGDLLWLFVAATAISLFEIDRSIAASAASHSLLFIVFEVISAYCLIGLSLGSSSSAASLVGALSGPSKLVIVCTMLIGRHRNVHDAIAISHSAKLDPLWVEED